MPITFLCPQCNRRLATATRKAGQVLVCPACTGQVVVPLVSRPVCPSGAGTRLGLGRLALVSALVAGFAAQALAISARIGQPDSSRAPADADAYTATLSSPAVPTLATHPNRKTEAEQPRTEPAPPPACVRSEPEATVATQAAAVKPPEPIFVCILRGEPSAAEPKTPLPPAGQCGTGLEFERTPLLASEKARKERKLLMLLHISGNFEDSKFT